MIMIMIDYRNHDDDDDDDDDDDNDDDDNDNDDADNDDEDGYRGCHLRERYCKGATGAKGVRPAVQAAVIIRLFNPRHTKHTHCHTLLMMTNKGWPMGRCNVVCIGVTYSTLCLLLELDTSVGLEKFLNLNNGSFLFKCSTKM